QIYCKRWQDSNNGASEGLVLRLSADEGDDAPLSTLAEVFARVYDDLDEAIKLFDESKIPRAANCDMGIDVAYAIYARAALVRNDWQTAATMADKAKARYPLMSNSELLNGGFYTPNSEWIWSSAGSTRQNLYYFSYHAYIAYNSTASAVRSYPALITKELYAKIPDTDVRRNWWICYKDLPIGRTTDPTIMAEVRAKYPKLDKSAYINNYMQFKIACEVAPGVGHLNHFRSSEMYLIEAEALARLNRSAEAQTVMNSLNRDSGRNPSYSCTATGQALLDEIWLYRDVELWGEGFDWFDLKRTKRGIDRSNKDNGGSYLSDLAVKIDPVTDTHEWVWIIPVRETDYNPGI
ncbi:MAG: RagB/SusD family nutrient uptake outer membrane protein, partial [Prevotellaceae bacterium]|nr:RagB/SusD family nutrient uptake outer membrane protein [Prevotellaceae bacterium]